MSSVSYRGLRPVLALACALTLGVSCGGSDDSKSLRIGAAGGSLVGPGGVAVAVPAGAVDTEFTLVIASAPTGRRPAGTSAAATAVRLSPEGQTFNKPVDVTIPISPTGLPAGRTIDDVVVVRAPQGSNAFVPLPTRRVGNAVVAQTDHFSDFVAVVASADGGMPFGQCGDTMCVGGETCSSCPFDCGLCIDGGVADGGVTLQDASVGPDAAGVDAGTAMRWVNNMDGSVTDTVTSLMWEHAPGSPLSDQAGAITYCTGLTIGGHTDWRVPSMRELLSLIDRTRSNTAIDPIFPSAPLGYIWSSDDDVSNTQLAWTVYTFAGATTTYLKNFAGGVSAWCTRGTDARPAIVFSDPGDGTIVDANAGLIWEKGTSGAMADYASAQTYCATTLAGGPWRVPTLDEVYRTIRFDRNAPAVDTLYFSAGAPTSYWTSTPYVVNAGENWYWTQASGSNGNSTTNTASFGVRCVK